MTRGEFLGGCLVALLITCSPGLAGVAVTALTGPDRLDAPTTSPTSAPEGEAGLRWEVQRPEAPSLVSGRRASRSRAVVRHAAGGVGGLNWHALAMCESTDNPHAVSPSGTYRGAFQMDRDFWRSYGGLRFASRPDLASYSEQLVVAKAGYAARGRSPWPVCGRRL